MTPGEFREEINNFVETQLALWPEAKQRYLNLGSVERKRVRLGRYEGAVQFNPGRVRSTTANVSKAAIVDRPCFLCKSNRPEQQLSVPVAEGWTLLLNPFPIFPIHLTIVSNQHRDQLPDFGSMVMLAEKMPGMVVFFNGAKAGASAPDHMHFQAVFADELPLLNAIESFYPASDSAIYEVEKGSVAENTESWPVAFRTGVVKPVPEGMKVLRDMARPTHSELVNIYVWIGHEGELRILEIPRKAHRPRCYTDSENPILISPGAIDMAGILIAVRPEDFEAAPVRIGEIYGEVAY